MAHNEMKTPEKRMHKQRLQSTHDTGADDEEKLLELSRHSLPDKVDDLDFDPSLRKIKSGWSGFDFENEEKSQLSPTSDGCSTPDSIEAAKAPILTLKSIQDSPEPGFARRIKRIFTKFPVRDPSWLAACLFTIGSGVFVINGFFLLLPMVQPGWNFKGEGTYAGPATSILGSTIFLLGGWAAMLQALNMKRGRIDGQGFDPEDDEELDEEKGDGHAAPQVLELSYDGASVDNSATERCLTPITSTIKPAMIGSSAFIWYPSLSEFRDMYQGDPRYIAAIIQMLGASIFSISTIANIPGVMDLTNTLVLDTLSLLPTFIGGLCFLIAALIQTRIAQDEWYSPTLWQLKWHIMFWNCVGSTGFALAGGLPLFGEGMMFQATLADFWGSWGFMIGSFIQWYVVRGNYP